MESPEINADCLGHELKACSKTLKIQIRIFRNTRLFKMSFGLLQQSRPPIYELFLKLSIKHMFWSHSDVSLTCR